MGDVLAGDGPSQQLDEMCEWIRAGYHARLRETLPAIGRILAGLTEADPAAAGSTANALAAFEDLMRQLEGHLAKEENVLFPALEAMARAEREGGNRPALPFPTVLHPIRVMETEHVRIESALDRLRQATNGFVAGEGASDAWRRCLSECSRFAAELQAHFRAENEVLFPRALELERRLL